jgi:hypothetical protein
MTTQEFAQFINEEFSKYTIRDLMIYAQTFNNQNSKTGDLIKSIIMDILKSRMPKQELINFYNEL